MTLAILGGLCAGVAVAEAQGVDPDREGSSFLSVAVGAFDVIAPGSSAAADLRLEYRHGSPLLRTLRPWAGVEVTTDGDLFAGGGPYLDLWLGDRIVLTGIVSAGAFWNGAGRDLGSRVQFRSQAEVAYRSADGSRIGVSFGHISNAGLGDPNPGAEALNVYLHIPISLFR